MLTQRIGGHSHVVPEIMRYGINSKDFMNFSTPIVQHSQLSWQSVQTAQSEQELQQEQAHIYVNYEVWFGQNDGKQSALYANFLVGSEETITTHMPMH